MRNVQFLDRDIEMQKMDRSTSREHLLIDFSSSSSSDDFRRENEEEEEEEEGVVLSRRVSPASSDIGVLPSHRRPSLFDDDSEVPLDDLAPGRKVLPLVDLGDVEDSLVVKKEEEDIWKWFVPPVSGKIHSTPLESTPSMVKPISKSISEPLPTTSLPLAMSEGILIDFHSEPDQEHVLVDLDDNNVPQSRQHEFVRVHTTHVDLDTAAKSAVSLDDPPTIRPALEGRRSLDSLMKPITTVDITTSNSISVKTSSSNMEESSQRGRKVDRHPLEEEVHELKVVQEKPEASPSDKKQDLDELVVNEHELYDHHNDNYTTDRQQHDHDHSPQSLDTIRASPSSSPQVATIPVQAAPAWYWDHVDDPWNGAVVVVNEEGGGDVEEEGLIEGTEEHRVKVEEGDEKGVDLIEVGEDEDVVKTSLKLPVERSLEEVPTETKDEQSYPDPDYHPSSPVVTTEIPLVSIDDRLPDNFQEKEEIQNEVLQHGEKSPRRAAALEVGEDEDIVKSSPRSEAIELPVEPSCEEEPTETEDEQSYPDPDYLPLPELLLDPSSPAAATEIPLVLVEDGPQENEEIQDDQDMQQYKDAEKSPRRTAAQMPTPPASPPTSLLRVKSLGVVVEQQPPSPNSLSFMGELLPLTSISPLSTTTTQSIPFKLGPSLVLTPPNTASLSPIIEIKTPKEDNKENTTFDKENESPNSAIGRPLWSIRADDAPALGLAASSLSSTTSSAGLMPGVGTNMGGGSPRTKRRVLGDVTAVVENNLNVESQETVKEEEKLKDEKDEEDVESSLPGAFPELVKSISSSDSDIIVAPTITIAALTSTLLTTSIAAASSSTSTSTPTPTSSSSTTTALETSPPLIKRRPIVRSPLDIALAMQLRPGLGVGADPAWMVRFLMAMFGWFAILVSGQGEY